MGNPDPFIIRSHLKKLVASYTPESIVDNVVWKILLSGCTKMGLNWKKGLWL